MSEPGGWSPYGSDGDGKLTKTIESMYVQSDNFSAATCLRTHEVIMNTPRVFLQTAVVKNILLKVENLSCSELESKIVVGRNG